MAESRSRHNTARTTPSCERCKQHKARCDRQLPACQRCVRSRSDCEYAGRRKPGFPAGHRQVLEDKVKRLEAELGALRGNPTANSAEAPVVVATRRAVSPTASIQPRDVSSATYERTGRLKERQPPTDLVLSLTSLYFRHIHPWFPFLDLKRVYSNMGSTSGLPLLYYALFGISLPFSFDSRLDRDSSDSFWKYSKRRIFIDVLEEPSYSSLEVLTVLVLDLSGMTLGPQVWGALAVATKLAVQLRNADDMVFRTSAAPESSGSLGNANRKFRERLFWAIYSLDCYICITTNYTSTLSDEHIQYFMPSRQQAWRESPGTATLNPNYIFSYNLELLDLSRKAHRVRVRFLTLHDDGESITRWLDEFYSISIEINNWTQALPLRLLWNDTAAQRRPGTISAAFLMLNGYFHALVIYINGLVVVPAYLTLQAEVYTEMRQQSEERCFRSIEVLAQIVSTASSQAWDQLGWPFCWSVWVAARFLIIQRCSSPLSEEHTQTTLPLFSDFLSKMGRFWQISATYARIIQRAISETSDSISPPQGSILRLMTDLRVSSSQLEDQSRPDPILHSFTTQEEAVSTHENTNYLELDALDQSSTLFPEDICFNIPQQTSDSWFREPLFASSAYQHYSTFEDD